MIPEYDLWLIWSLHLRRFYFTHSWHLNYTWGGMTFLTVTSHQWRYKGKQNKSHKNADLPSLRNFPCFTSAMLINRIYPSCSIFSVIIYIHSFIQQIHLLYFIQCSVVFSVALVSQICTIPNSYCSIFPPTIVPLKHTFKLAP